MNKFKLDYSQKKQLKHQLKMIIMYAVLIVFGYTFIYPIIYSLFYSFFSLDDITNPLVNWIAQNPTLDSYKQLLSTNNFLYIISFSTVYAGFSALFQMISCSLIGYGFARYNFKLKKIFLALIIIIFIIPQQVLIIQNFILMGNLGINNTLLAFFLPALLGQGINSSIFILIFYAFFAAIPEEIYESAQMEGASPFQSFFKITLPLVKGAMIITFVLSFVWYWNDTTFTTQYYTGMPTLVNTISSSISAAISTSDDPTAIILPIYDGLKSAAVVILVIPLIIFYFIFQKQFTNSVENSGLTGQ